jgi:hypothetical protein
MKFESCHLSLSDFGFASWSLLGAEAQNQKLE